MNPTPPDAASSQSSRKKRSSSSSKYHRFVTEGQFVALPLAVPGVCDPIAEDESHLRRVVLSASGAMVFMVSEGTQSHLLMGRVKGAVCGIAPYGTLGSAGAVAAIASGVGRRSTMAGVLLAVRGDDGDEVVWQLGPMISDSIQEASWRVTARRNVVTLPGDEAVRDLRQVDDSGDIAALRETGVELIDLSEKSVTRLAGPALPAARAGVRLIKCAGQLGWLAGSEQWATLDAEGRIALTPLDHAVPEGEVAMMSRARPGEVAVVMRNGAVWTIDPAAGRARPVAQLELSPIQCAAALSDGRVYAMCGSELAQFCRVELATGEVAMLGAVASAMVAPRYGFNFADASVSEEGVIAFAEHDRGGHLWLYYPPVRTAHPAG